MIIFVFFYNSFCVGRNVCVEQVGRAKETSERSVAPDALHMHSSTGPEQGHIKGLQRASEANTY